MLAPRAVQAFSQYSKFILSECRPSLIRTVLSYLRSIDVQLAKFSKRLVGLSGDKPWRDALFVTIAPVEKSTVLMAELYNYMVDFILLV